MVVWLTDINGKGSNRVDITSSTLVTPQWRKVSIPVTQFTGVDLRPSGRWTWTRTPIRSAWRAA